MALNRLLKIVARDTAAAGAFLAEPSPKEAPLHRVFAHTPQCSLRIGDGISFPTGSSDIITVPIGDEAGVDSGLLGIVAGPRPLAPRADACLDEFATIAGFMLSRGRSEESPSKPEVAGPPRSGHGRPTVQLEEEQLIERQHLYGIGKMAGAVAHDANNLLMAALGRVGIAASYLSPDSPAHESLTEANKVIERLARLMEQLAIYSGRRTSARRAHDLGALIEQTSEVLRVSTPKNVTLQFELDTDGPPVDVDAGELRRVVMLMLLNATEALGGAPGLVTLRTGRRPPGAMVFLEFEDSGHGMEPEVQAQIFDAQFTTKPGATGLGLTTALDIVRRHGGAIDVRSEPGRGSTFTLLFPESTAPAQVSAASLDPGAALSFAKRSALIVDDEAEVREVVRLMLESLRFEVVCVEDGARAIEQLKDPTSRFDLVLLDMSMPQMDGLEVLTKLREIDSDLNVILMSGDRRVTTRSGSGPEVVVLNKPFGVEVLGYAVAEALYP